MDMPGVKLEFLQLTSTGLPATQYFPETLRFVFSFIFRAAIRSNTTDKVTRGFLVGREMSQFFGQNAEVRAPRKLTSDFCSEILIMKSHQTKPEF